VRDPLLLLLAAMLAACSGEEPAAPEEAQTQRVRADGELEPRELLARMGGDVSPRRR
jgi:hypothetical protein